MQHLPVLLRDQFKRIWPDSHTRRTIKSNTAERKEVTWTSEANPSAQPVGPFRKSSRCRVGVFDSSSHPVWQQSSGTRYPLDQNPTENQRLLPQYVWCRQLSTRKKCHQYIEKAKKVHLPRHPRTTGNRNNSIRWFIHREVTRTTVISFCHAHF